MTLRLMLLLLGLAALIGIYLHGRRGVHRQVPRQTAGHPALGAASAGAVDPDRLYVKVIGARLLTGEEIRNALEDADMQSGEMRIFHYYSEGPSGRRALVSAADMYEPGTLDGAALDRLETRGLVLFLPPCGGTRAQLAQCARIVAAGLHAQVFDAGMRPLERGKLVHMCEENAEQGPGP